MSKEFSDLIHTGTVTLLPAVVFIIAFFFIYRRRHLRYLYEKQQLTLSFEQELLKTRLEIQEQTFRNISQEIHDNIGQVLSLAKLNISTMDISHPDNLIQKIIDSEKLISKAIHDL